jgi:DNA-directed RNA polymerase specialized sigma24 family protein
MRERLSAEAERALVEAAQGGDREAVAALCVAMRAMIEALAREHAGALSAEDLAQEGYAALVVALRTYDAGRGPLTPFARVSARGAMLRATLVAVRAQSSAWEDGVTHETPEDVAAARLWSVDAQNLLSRDEATALRLRHDGLTWREVGAAMGVSGVWARKLGTRGMARVRNLT